MKRFIRRFIDDRFALTTLQNPTWEVRTQAELIAAAEAERERQRQAAPPPQTPPLTAAPHEIEREIASQIEPDSEPSVEPEFEPEFESAPPLPPAGQPEHSTNEFDASATLAPKKKPRKLPKRKSRRAKKSTRARSAKKRRHAKPRGNSAPDSLPARMQTPAPAPAFAREINKLAGFLVRANKLGALSAASTHAIEQHTGAAPHDHPEHLSQRQMGDNLELEVEVEVEEYDDPRLPPTSATPADASSATIPIASASKSTSSTGATLISSANNMVCAISVPSTVTLAPPD
jgi:hypothetical protein